MANRLNRGKFLFYTVDLDQDGNSEVLMADMRNGTPVWYTAKLTVGNITFSKLTAANSK